MPSSLNLFNKDSETIIINKAKNAIEENIQYIKVHESNVIEEMLRHLCELNIQSVLVEGGSKTLQSFIDADLWDEARIITNEEMVLEEGIIAPQLKNRMPTLQEKYESDRICYFYNYPVR